MDRKRNITNCSWLLALALAVQAWLAWRASTPALDSVRFLEIAREIRQRGVIETWRSESEHPLYPTVVAVTGGVLETWLGDRPERMRMAALAACALPLLLSAFLVYTILGTIFSRPVACVGGLIFILTPRVATLGAEAISDSWHLLLALLALAIVLRPRRLAASVPRRHESDTGGLLRAAGSAAWIVAGTVIAVALLARAEALLLLGALPAWSAVESWRRGDAFVRVLAAGSRPALALALGTSVVLVPYLMVCEAKTPASAVARILGRGDGAHGRVSGTEAPAASEPLAFADGTAMSFPVKETRTTSRFSGLSAATKEFFRELWRLMHLSLVFAGLGLVFARGRRGCTWRRFSLGFGMLVALASVGMASRTGYLSARHLVLLMPLGASWAAMGVFSLRRLGRGWRWECIWLPRRNLPRFATAALLLVFASGLWKPLHESRLAHRLAGEFLRDQGSAGDLVLDTRGLSGMYSGLETLRYQSAGDCFRDERLRFVVIERREIDGDSPRALTLRRLLDESGTLAGEFRAPRVPHAQEVLVYRWHPERFARLTQNSTRRRSLQ